MPGRWEKSVVEIYHKNLGSAGKFCYANPEIRLDVLDVTHGGKSYRVVGVYHLKEGRH